MKTALILVTSLLLAGFTDQPIDRLGITGPLLFGKTNFELAWSDKPKDNYYVQEYLPKNESLEKFNQMLAIHLFVMDNELKSAVQQKMKWLEERKKTDPVCNYNLIESPDGKEFILDFIVGQNESNKMTIAEFNVYKYSKITLQGKNAIVVYSFSKRSYGDAITSFLKDLSTDRNMYLNQMISATGNKIAIQKF